MSNNRFMTMTRRNMQWRCSEFLIIIALLIGFSLLPMQSLAATSVLESVDYAPLPGNQTRIALKFSGMVPKPQSFTVANPALPRPGPVSSNATRGSLSWSASMVACVSKPGSINVSLPSSST